MVHNNLSIQFLKAIFYLAEMQGREMCFNPNDGNLYVVKEKGRGCVTCLPLGRGEDATIFDLNPATLIFHDNLADGSEINWILTENNGFETDIQQTIQQSNNSALSAPKQTDTNTITANPQNYIGFGKVDLQKFSGLYTGETAKYSAQVETLLDKIFAATNKPQTIEKSIANYNDAKKFAKNGQLYELKQLAERLQGRIAKQGAMQKGKDTIAAQQAARRKMLLSAVIAIVIAVAYFCYQRSIEKSHSTQTESDIQPTAAVQISPLDEAIAEFEASTGIKIYPKGRECLAKATVGMNKDQCFKVIQQNIKQ